MVCMRYKTKGVGRMWGDAGAHPVCQVKTLINPNHTPVPVRSSGYGGAGIGLSS